MELTCYTLREDAGIEIRPAPSRRDWMDVARERAAYRCLPLVVANAYGWEILSPVSFTAIWNGGQDKEGLVVLEDLGAQAPAHSHFGEGILAFSPPLLFRTDPGTDLLVQGPVNRPKDAISPLTGLVESDWGPFSFTMNWKFTRAETPVRFRKTSRSVASFRFEGESWRPSLPRSCRFPRTPTSRTNIQSGTQKD